MGSSPDSRTLPEGDVNRRGIAGLSGVRAVWALTALVTAAAVVLYTLILPALDPIDAPVHIPWWALTALLAASQMWTVHLFFRRSAQSFNLSELVIVPGLVLAAPRDLVIACIVGPAVVLALRNPPVKLAFNLAQMALNACIAILLYHGLAGGEAIGPQAWGAAFVAMIAGGVACVALLSAAISMTEGNIDWRETLRMLGFDTLVTATLTAVGLAVTTLVVLDARSTWLLAVPIVAAMAAYRAYLVERRRRERLEFLYDATHALSLASTLSEAVLDLLARSRVAFRAELAELVLLPAAGGVARRARVSSEGAEAMTPLDGETAAALQALADGGVGARILDAPGGDSPLDAYLRDAGVVRSGLLAVLQEEGEPPLGVMIVAIRPDVDRKFGASDVRLLGKLAANAAASLAHETLEQDFGRLEQLQTELEHMAFHDPLTGLANRARFTEQVSHALARRDALVAALFIDLDDFKTVNDSMGHRAGDELLVGVAERLRSSLRAHDTPARLGGDEFAVLVEDAENMEVVLEIAERILASLDAPLAITGGNVVVRASIGVATSAEGVRNADDLVRNADLAMYRAKNQGKGCVELFQPEMHANAVQRHELKSELQRAVDSDQFVVLYQPVVDLRGGQVAGVEALVRWQHPRLGLVGPDDFIPLAEEAGLIAGIGRHVLAKACEKLALWRRASIAGDAFTLSINLSVREFQSAELVESLRHAAAHAGVPSSAITLEITESALMEDFDSGVARMREIKAAGFRLALDDFGTGYSSLGHLRSFPIDVLKIAKPFVDHIAERERDAAFLRSILELARTLSLDVVVEGVETAEQARILLGMGARNVQGFVFSRPVDDRALSAMLTLTPLRGFAEAPVAGIEPRLSVPPPGLISASSR